MLTGLLGAADGVVEIGDTRLRKGLLDARIVGPRSVVVTRVSLSDVFDVGKKQLLRQMTKKWAQGKGEERRDFDSPVAGAACAMLMLCEIEAWSSEGRV